MTDDDYKHIVIHIQKHLAKAGIKELALIEHDQEVRKSAFPWYMVAHAMLKAFDRH